MEPEPEPEPAPNTQIVSDAHDAHLSEMAAALKAASQAQAAAEAQLQAQLEQQEAAVAAAKAEPRKAAPGRSERPVFRILESHQLEEYFEKLLEMGVKRVEDLEQMNQEDMAALGMNRFDRNKFQAAFITETPHHGGVSTTKDSAAMPLAAGGFTFEASKHAMLSYQ